MFVLETIKALTSDTGSERNIKMTEKENDKI